AMSEARGHTGEISAIDSGTRTPDAALVTAPYQAIGLVPTMWGIRRREEIAKNLEHLEHLVKAAFWLGGLDLPVRLVAIPEGALQGFTDEGMDTDHEEYARGCAIDIPGPETQRPGAPAREGGTFLIAPA